MNNLSFLRHTFLRGFYSNPFTLTYAAGANGSVVGASPQVVDAGNSGSPVTAVSNINYRFLSWSDGVLTATRMDTNVGDNITVTANFVILVYSVNIPLERGPHTVYVQASDLVGTVSTLPIVYVAAYELTEYGIDIYSGDAKLDTIEPILHDALLPDLPTLNFSCATLLSGTIQAVIRERGLRQYQFTIATVAISGPLYVYTCLAAESYALTTAIMTFQTAYGSTANAIRLLAPALNIVSPELLAQTTYPQLYVNIAPTEIIKQLLIQALAQASVRNGNLYVFPLDVSAQIPDYHMQRADPLTGWQKDANVYDAVMAHYTVKQYPSPDTVLTLNDAANWIGTVTDVTQVASTLLPVPSGALGMLKSVGNCNRAGLSAAFKNFDRLRFNWNPPDVGATVTVSLQQDASNKLELTHTFAGEQSVGFGLTGTVPADILTKEIPLSPIQYVTKVTGSTTGACSYRVTLLYENGATQWVDVWRSTIGNTFQADVPTDISHIHTGTVRIEFTNLYLIGAVYGVQVVTCDITVQTYANVGSHAQVVSSVVYQLTYHAIPDTYQQYQSQGLSALPAPPAGQWYKYIFSVVNGNYPYLYDLVTSWAVRFEGPGSPPWLGTVTVTLMEIVQDYAWVPVSFSWSPAFNLFESVTIALVDMVRTGNPTNLATIALTWTGDNYLDALVMVADNPLPVTVRAGTGQQAYTVTDDFGSEVGAQAYADGLLPVVSVAREQYTRDVPLETDLSVGDTISGDGAPMTVYAVDYRQNGKTLAAGRAMDTLMTRLAEQARRIGTLERKA